jgi:hypothetical protein
MAEAATCSWTTLFEREIAKFMGVVRRGAESDVYLGRRAFRRYYRAWPLLVTPLNDSGVRAEFSAVLYNASEGGLGFYSARPFKGGTLLAVKLFWDDPHGCRVPVVVLRCETREEGVLIGLRCEEGYLLGCEFAHGDAAACEKAAALSPCWHES